MGVSKSSLSSSQTTSSWGSPTSKPPTLSVASSINGNTPQTLMAPRGLRCSSLGPSEIPAAFLGHVPPSCTSRPGTAQPATSTSTSPQVCVKTDVAMPTLPALLGQPTFASCCPVRRSASTAPLLRSPPPPTSPCVSNAIPHLTLCFPMVVASATLASLLTVTTATRYAGTAS